MIYFFIIYDFQFALKLCIKIISLILHVNYYYLGLNYTC